MIGFITPSSAEYFSRHSPFFTIHQNQAPRKSSRLWSLSFITRSGDALGPKTRLVRLSHRQTNDLFECDTWSHPVLNHFISIQASRALNHRLVPSSADTLWTTQHGSFGYFHTELSFFSFMRHWAAFIGNFCVRFLNNIPEKTTSKLSTYSLKRGSCPHLNLVANDAHANVVFPLQHYFAGRRCCILFLLLLKIFVIVLKKYKQAKTFLQC